MRVIAGELRSRKLKGLPGMDVRPTPDRLRESLFNVLAPRISGAVFLDAYAGTGAVGIEALSRGAARAIFIERNRAAAAVLRDNLATLDLEQRATVYIGKATEVLARVAAAITFVDPPYPLAKEYADSLEILGRNAGGLVIVQHSSRQHLEERQGALRKVRVLRQGDNSLSFFEREP